MRDFNHTINVLVQAFLNNTLVHGNCTACAVGNIITDACGLKYRINEMGELDWNGDEHAYWYTSMFGVGGYKVRETPGVLKTGYSPLELGKIEFAFEEADYGNDENEWMFNGLMAVVDVLAEIHGISLESKESAKALFVKA